MGDYVLFKNLDGKYLTLKDCIEENKKETEETEAQTEEKKEDAAESENLSLIHIYNCKTQFGP